MKVALPVGVEVFLQPHERRASARSIRLSSPFVKGSERTLFTLNELWHYQWQLAPYHIATHVLIPLEAATVHLLSVSMSFVVACRMSPVTHSWKHRDPYAHPLACTHTHTSRCPVFPFFILSSGPMCPHTRFTLTFTPDSTVARAIKCSQLTK